ncbi:sulfite dehydrogenase subunit SoeC [uncultured Lamprocystis sp.]|jgi:DMSO reductase anchor subunit|uniref:sulfite dehydrogenase subunit SoeC n=1 Tax=uncultured Lamprocystis sp. TaxID=543132 RepID=UPI0025D4E33D|nr:sulfite dehydrogenase subunit SoeC [uncultured Lamprocystis sp.]
MHPAFSVIFLTTLIGAGQGLFLALYTGQIYALANLLPAQGDEFYAFGSLVALTLLVGGLIASFFHLGRPERAWRAAARWRTSWLSREVLVLPLVMALVFAYGLAHWTAHTQSLFTLGNWLAVDATLLIGLAATLAVFALFVCTAMIYAGVRFLEEWSSPLTVINFTLFGLASGFMLAAAYSAFIGNQLVAFFGTWSVIFTLMALISRFASLTRNARLQHKSTVQSAIGVRHQTVSQKAQGATAGSFNTREFFHGRSAGTLRTVRLLFLFLVFPLPILLIGAAYATQSPTLPIVAFAVQYLGLLFERWFFFAEARHPQNLYYQSVA